MTLQQLFPTPPRTLELEGAYLAHDLRQYAAPGRPFVYANFVTSIDGRIAVSPPDGSGLTVPKAVANARDWRLFQELAAQADLIISSGRYLRDWADGRAQEILQVDDPRFADLRAWRAEQGLSPQPDIAIISASLRFPIPEILHAGGRKVVIFTTADPDPARMREIEDQAGRVFVVGDQSVQGDRMVQVMGELGYRTVYSAAGPRVLHLLLAGGVLDRLYLTYANRLLGGKLYAGIVDGPLLEPPVDLALDALYWDAAGVDGNGQLFATYSRPG